MTGGLRRGRAVPNPAADQLLDAGRVETAVRDAGGDHAAPCAKVPAAAQVQLEAALGPRLGADDLDPDEDLGAEAQRLRVGAAGQFAPADALREAGVVLDPRARARLAARGHAFENDRAQPLGGGVDRSGEPSGPCPDDDDVVQLVLGLRAQAGTASDFAAP